MLFRVISCGAATLSAITLGSTTLSIIVKKNYIKMFGWLPNFSQTCRVPLSCWMSRPPFLSRFKSWELPQSANWKQSAPFVIFWRFDSIVHTHVYVPLQPFYTIFLKTGKFAIESKKTFYSYLVRFVKKMKYWLWACNLNIFTTVNYYRIEAG